MQRLDIAGHDEGNAPFNALGPQPVVDQVRVLAADDHGDVPGVEEGLAPGKLGADGMTAPHRERVAVGIEQLAMKTLKRVADRDRKSTRLNSSHQIISYAVFCLKKKKEH